MRSDCSIRIEACVTRCDNSLRLLILRQSLTRPCDRATPARRVYWQHGTLTLAEDRLLTHRRVDAPRVAWRHVCYRRHDDARQHAPMPVHGCAGALQHDAARASFAVARDVRLCRAADLDDRAHVAARSRCRVATYPGALCAAAQGYLDIAIQAARIVLRPSAARARARHHPYEGLLTPRWPTPLSRCVIPTNHLLV